MIILLDNYDSFTWNLWHFLQEIGAKVKIIKNDELTIDDIISLNPSGLVISPGPGVPENAGITVELIKETKKLFPIFGVCLGHQAIAEAFGSELENMDEVLHGVGNKIKVLEDDVLYNDIPKEFEVGRYHSWQVKKETLGDIFKLTSVDENGNVMSIRHNSMDLVGVQYHPESILTEYGLKIIENWLKS